jgi:hypothetical protein
VNRLPVSTAERWCVDIPFSIYLGWITVATVANIADWLYLVEWNGFGIAPQAWAIIMIVVASMLGLLMTLTRKDAAYVLVLAWSFVGIAVKQASVQNIFLTAWFATFFMLVLAVYNLMSKLKVQNQSAQRVQSI